MATQTVSAAQPRSSFGEGERFVLTLSCADRRGIVRAVAQSLIDLGCTISDSQQFGDPSGSFYMRVAFRTESGRLDHAHVEAVIATHVEEFEMSWSVTDAAQKNRVVLMVSKQGHCLTDLLFRAKSGTLPIEVVAVVSNHTDMRDLVDWYGIPFHHVPVTSDTKQLAEDELRGLVAKYEADTVVLARYMQILSDRLCADLSGRAINIHHSLLPSFKGARPYYQAYDRGVKVIGATAHYVTADLDEGPIIEQDFVRVDHTRDPQELTAIGQDQEARALARAVKWHAERRVLLVGTKTVVFT